MILEGIVTTVDEQGGVHIAPMGPTVDAEMKRFVLRPFQTSTTFRNLHRTGEGVLHVTDDVGLLARAAIGSLRPPPEVVPANGVTGYRLADTCRWYSFRVVSLDDREDRATLVAEVVAAGRVRDFFGFNRAKHAVVEAAILATRTSFLPESDVVSQFRQLKVLVEKTGGEQERVAFEMLEAHVRAAYTGQGSPMTPPDTVLPGKPIAVLAPSRLHFGMLSFGQRDTRQFGGVGAMISAPGLRLSIAPCDTLEVIGLGADRARQFIARLANRAAWWPARAACRIDIEEAPPAHAGLGSGTQFGMALAIGLARFFGAPPQSARELAQAVGRGRRSAIGIYGAISGGLLVESGKFAAGELSPLACRVELPDQWRFVLFLAEGAAGLSGEAEQRAFDELPPVPPHLTARLCREVLGELIPAAVQGDFDRFGDSLYRYGRMAGECFAPAQGGVYANPRIERLVDHCRRRGVLGVGQSSWGPSVFALTQSAETAESLVTELHNAGELTATEIVIASPDNCGCRIA